MLCYSFYFNAPNTSKVVLILIVMEYALLQYTGRLIKWEKTGLNPYCNGICSATNGSLNNDVIKAGLNPYCNGICSATSIHSSLLEGLLVVLILIVMEYALLLNHDIFLMRGGTVS